MDFINFEIEFSKLGDNYKTKDLDLFNRSLIKRGEDVTFLGDMIISTQKYHRTFFQVSLAKLKTIEEKLAFIEGNFDKLQDWWHVDQLSQFVDKFLNFELAYTKSKEYMQSNLPFVRRWAYVLFMPTLVKNEELSDKLFCLFKDDDDYYVQMAEAWLISYLGIYYPEKTLTFLKNCNLKYNIIGKAIQKICDSHRVNDDYKEHFKKIRKKYK